MSEQATLDLKERIEKKLDSAQENRDNMLKSVQDRIKEHVRNNPSFADHMQICPVSLRVTILR